MVQKRRFMDDFYFLEDERVRQFLIVGKEEALLIDTGFEDSHVYDVVRSITELPVRGYVPYTSYSAKESYIEENPEVIQKFTNALQRGMEYVQTHTPGSR